MAISGMLNVSTYADVHKRQIDRSRPSLESIYRYGVGRIAAWLSTMEKESIEDMPKTAANISHYLNSIRERILLVLPTRLYLHELTSVMGYLTTVDRVILTYEILVEAVSNLTVGHRGPMHTPTCSVCLALCHCLAVDQAVRESLPAVQRADAARRALLTGPPVSHRCHITSVRVPYGRQWRVTCLTCGVVSSSPQTDSDLVADLARDHARLAAWRDKLAAGIG